MTKTLTDILKEAGALLEKRDYTSASTLYQEAMKLQPGNAAAAMGIAMIHNRTGQPEEALKILQGVWKSISSSKMKKAVAPKAAVLSVVSACRCILPNRAWKKRDDSRSQGFATCLRRRGHWRAPR